VMELLSHREPLGHCSIARQPSYLGGGEVVGDGEAVGGDDSKVVQRGRQIWLVDGLLRAPLRARTCGTLSSTMPAARIIVVIRG
jgi:hypothetical protein